MQVENNITEKNCPEGECCAMKRRDFLKNTAALVGWFAIGGMPLGYTSKQERDYYHILLISDLHLPVRKNVFSSQEEQDDIWGKKQALLKTVNDWKDVDEVALLGDLAARYGNEEEFRVVDEYVGALRYKYYAVAGNHDYAYEDKPKVTKKGKVKKVEAPLEMKQAKLAAFQKRYHLPSAYYARDIGSCRLLYLAPDGCRSDVDLSREQLDWLKQEIAAHPKGPILFFCHAPIMGTLRTYKPKINTVKNTVQPADTLAEILANVPPGSLWISGHTHTPPTNDSYADTAVNRANPNLVDIHTPSIDAPHLYTNSLYIYKDRLVIRTYDHNNGKWLDKLERTFSFSGT